jgi:hypothetical protein
MRERGGALGFEEKVVGGPVNTASEGPGENPAASTIRAAESPSRGEVEPNQRT